MCKFSLGGKYREQIVIVLDVDIVTAFLCTFVLSEHSMYGMPSLAKTDTPPYALPPISRLIKLIQLKPLITKSSVVNMDCCKQQTTVENQ